MAGNCLAVFILVFVILGVPGGVLAGETADTRRITGEKEVAEYCRYQDVSENIRLKTVPRGTVELVISVDRQTLTVYDDNKKFKVYHVAVGKEETPTPIGVWKIKRKAKHWGTGFGSRWMGLNVPWGIYGIHGTNKPWSIGTRASHGCIRMLNRDVEELYEWVKPGTVVRIEGRLYPALYEQRDKVHRGHKGSVVMEIQKGLIREGYLKGPVDGIFGGGTEAALKKLQKDRGFEVTGQVDVDIWGVLGL